MIRTFDNFWSWLVSLQNKNIKNGLVGDWDISWITNKFCLWLLFQTNIFITLILENQYKYIHFLVEIFPVQFDICLLKALVCSKIAVNILVLWPDWVCMNLTGFILLSFLHKIKQAAILLAKWTAALFFCKIYSFLYSFLIRRND